MIPSDPPFLFYRLGPVAPTVPSLPDGFRFELWRPAWRRPLAPGLSPLTSLVWYAFHVLGLFANRDYSAGVIWQGRRVAHVTVVFPGFFRFPFMAGNDIQFGALFTDPDFRGRRLAGYAVAELARQLCRPGRECWYITHESNASSQQVAARVGFQLVGRGDKLPRLGLRVLGSYAIINVIKS